MDQHSRPLRVLSVSAQYYPDLGGVETHVHEVTRRLALREDFELTVFASDRSGRLPRAERGEGFDIIRRRSFPRTRDYYFAPGLVRVIASGDWDLVHVQGIHTLVPVLAMATARLTGTPYVVTFHTGGHSSAARSSARDLQWKVLSPLLRGARKLIGVSRFERRLFEKATGVESSRFAVIRNGGALPAVPPNVRPVPGRIVSSGRLERYKGHHRVVEALPVVRETHPDAHLVILGAGPFEDDLRRLATELGVAEAVEIRYVQPGDRAAMARELAQASVMAALSDYEAHPVAVMEALTLGVPVVGYDIAGIADLVEDGTVVGLEPGATAAAAAAALVGVMQPDRAPDQPVALDLPTWEASADQLAQVYLGVGPRGPGRRLRWRRSVPVNSGAAPLRVVHISTTLTTGGAERQVQFLAEDAAVDSSVICLYGSGLVGDALEAAGVPVTVLGMAGLRKLTATVRLAVLLRRARPDVVHVHMLSAMLWGLPAAALARVPVVLVTEHSIMESTIEGRPKTPVLRRVYLVLVALATRCIAVSDVTEARLREWGVPGDKIVVIDNGIDFGALAFSPTDRAAGRRELDIPAADRVVIAVGRLDPVKRFDVLLDALAGWLRGPGHWLVVVGDGPLRAELSDQADRLGVADAVHFLGPQQDVAAWLSVADVFVSPSRDETFGMAVVEAVGNGLPVVFGQCPALDDLRSALPGAHAVPLNVPLPRELTELSSAVSSALAGPLRHDVPQELLLRYGLAPFRTATRQLYEQLIAGGTDG